MRRQRKNLDELAKLMQIYQMFSPEQTAREELLRGQVEGQRYQNRGLGQAFSQNEQLFPEQLATTKAERDRVELGNLTAREEAPLRIEALKGANAMTAEQRAALAAENAFQTEYRPVQLDTAKSQGALAKGLVNPQIKSAIAQAQGLENENDLFPVLKRFNEGKAKEQDISNEHAAGVYRGQERLQAAQIMQLLASSGFSNNVSDQSAIDSQELLRAIGGDSIPAEMTPGANIFSGVPEGDRRLMSEAAQVNIGTERAFQTQAPLLRSFAHKYPKAFQSSMPSRTRDLMQMYNETNNPDFAAILKRYEESQRAR